VHSQFQNVKRGVQLESKYEEGCAIKMPRGVCIQNVKRGCAFKISVGVCIQNFGRGVHSNYRQGCAFTNVHLPMHTP